jgi:hypothetical protein
VGLVSPTPIISSVVKAFGSECADCHPVDQSLPTQLTRLAGQFDQRRQPVDHPTERRLSTDSVEKLVASKNCLENSSVSAIYCHAKR